MATSSELVEYKTLNLHQLSGKLNEYNSPPTTPLSEDSDSFGSISDYGRTSTVMSRTLGSMNLEFILSDDKVNETLSGNPKNWHWNQVSLWLTTKPKNMRCKKEIR